MSFAIRVPTIKELYHIIRKVAYKWEELTVYLELDKDGGRVLAIRRDFIQHGVEICCLQALHHWLNGEGKQPVTWATLLSCLKDMDCSAVASQIEQAGENGCHFVNEGNLYKLS